MILFFFFENLYYIILSMVFLSFSASILIGLIVNKWLFVVIMLVFLGGIIILFFYIVRLTPATKQKTKWNKTLTLIFFFTCFLNNETLKYTSYTRIVDLYSSQSVFSLYYMTGILFITLAVCVKTLECFKGSVVAIW